MNSQQTANLHRNLKSPRFKMAGCLNRNQNQSPPRSLFRPPAKQGKFTRCCFFADGLVYNLQATRSNSIYLPETSINQQHHMEVLKKAAPLCRMISLSQRYLWLAHRIDQTSIDKSCFVALFDLIGVSKSSNEGTVPYKTIFVGMFPYIGLNSRP